MDDNTPLQLNYDKIVKHKEFLSVTRMLAVDIMKNPYMTPADFLKALSNEELETLMEISDDDEHERMDEIMLISEMLATAEGLPAANLDVATERVNQFCVFLVLESLSRKELVNVKYENMSFGEDYKDAIIAEKR
jgi:predicted house-cleaning noncanonical NTP pyrophosphatase (MazG superfamily)